jgi:hypothetical protein
MQKHKASDSDVTINIVVGIKDMCEIYLPRRPGAGRHEGGRALRCGGYKSL